MDLFEELNESISSVEAYEPKNSYKKLVAGEYNFKIIEAKINYTEEKTEVVLTAEVEDEGEWNGCRHWFNLTTKGAPIDWINEANRKYLKQIMMVNDTEAIKNESDFVDWKFGAKLEERKGYLNLRRVYRSVSDPGPRGKATSNGKVAMVETKDPFASF